MSTTRILPQRLARQLKNEVRDGALQLKISRPRSGIITLETAKVLAAIIFFGATRLDLSDGWKSYHAHMSTILRAGTIWDRDLLTISVKNFEGK